MFQAALTVHNIDADSAIWTCSSIITDDRSSCRFSDDEEVSEYMYIIMLQLRVRKVRNCAKADNCVLELTLCIEKIVQLFSRQRDYLTSTLPGYSLSVFIKSGRN